MGLQSLMIILLLTSALSFKSLRFRRDGIKLQLPKSFKLSNKNDNEESFETDIVQNAVVPIANTTFLSISVTSPFGPACNNVSHALEQLNLLLSRESFDHPRIEYLVKFLESKYTPIHTPQFFNMAHSGNWKFMYTNVLTRLADETL
jgi:hypothetical protein